MKALSLLSAIVIASWMCGSAQTGDDQPAPPRDPKLFWLFPRELNVPIEKWDPRTNLEIGDLIQFSFVSDRAKKEHFLRTLKVELKGDAVELTGVVEVQMRFPPNKKVPEGLPRDPFKQNLS